MNKLIEKLKALGLSEEVVSAVLVLIIQFGLMVFGFDTFGMIAGLIAIGILVITPTWSEIKQKIKDLLSNIKIFK